jgi:hypothetical protein
LVANDCSEKWLCDYKANLDSIKKKARERGDEEQKENH